MKKIDITGQQFTRLTVVAEAGRGQSGQAMWKCRCICGHEIVVQGCNLRSGHTKSCGCTRTTLRQAKRSGLTRPLHYEED